MRRGGGGGQRGRGGAQTGQLAEAQAMLQRAQEELATKTVEGTSGGGAVRVTMNGEQKVQAIAIEPDVVDPEDVEMLEDLVLAAIHDASERANALQADSLGMLTGGLDLPGLGG
ncbi:MAG: YbaB/EbfC family nucleoid-associated protein [Dehalococcoidia bacterium]|nr:YbaB/EbfC family nucleoid-associated protein [Dehalococcoidia bacterium]MYD28432.1 YbaB/EbfC family nucleoid-associated protein [Dehalococcoidia bacterium]